MLRRLCQTKTTVLRRPALTRGLSSSVPVLAQPPPELAETLRRVLKNAQPVLERSTFDDLTKRVEAFGGSLGSVLQERIEKENSFVNNVAVQGRQLASRSPLYVKSNWWFQLKLSCSPSDHPNHPTTLVSKPPPKDVISSFQIKRASGLILNLLNYKELIQSNTSSAAYENLFGSARIPNESVDIVTNSPESKHIVVLIKDQIYKLEVIDKDGNKPSLKELQRLLYAIGADSLESEIQPPVGLFTTENRIEWSQHHTLLSTTSPENKANLDTISSALFAICLDDHSTIANMNHSHHQFLHNSNGKNRWFDKPLQLILASSGRAGINAEVSIVDPSVYIKLAEFLSANEFSISEKQSSATSSNQDPLFASPEKLTWTLPDTLQKSLESTLAKSTTLASSTESVVLETDIYGSRYISQVAKTAQVDAFLQIALVVSWNRLHKTKTLISGTTTDNGEKFLTGTRGGQELWEFVEAFDNDDVLYDDKREKFRAAVEALREQPVDLVAESHVSALMAAVEGDVEREEVEGLFSGALLGATKAAGKKVGLDVVDVGSALTSSNGGSFYAGFAAQAWASGYGIAYSVGLDNIKVSVSNKKGGKTNAYRFTDALKRTLVDMMILFPKRSEVWGYDWKEKFARKRKEEYYLKTMKKLSDGYLGQKESLAKKYAGQLKK
ncbi:UNVERIFIED_CONTAM: hypothetical protein HDU68_007123 [Siphonaria sp. JEL0065]|nr:hypothetical protein HDU68_007123 [Siphonaria sp. JEL0065]